MHHMLSKSHRIALVAAFSFLLLAGPSLAHWFGSDSTFAKKATYPFSIKNPNDHGGGFSKTLTSGQWTAIKRLVRDVIGSTVYWFVESWDDLGRYVKTELATFSLED